MPELGTGQTQSGRLDSWKSIAAFFGRDERTVKRWERERGLPVHRLPGARGGVYAYSGELADWMQKPSYASPATPPVVPEEISSASPASAEPAASESLPPGQNPAVPTWANIVWISTAILMVVGLGIMWRITAGRQSNPQRSTTVIRRVDPEVVDLYLKGRFHWDKRTPEDLTKAAQYFQQAIARDPNYAAAYVGLADTYNLLREYTPMPDTEAYPLAMAAARKAIDLDPSSAEAHKALAFGTFYWDWDPESAEREFRRALELDPNCSVAHHWYATFLLTEGRSEEALKEIERARQLNPASIATVADKGLILYSTGAKQEAMAVLKQVEESTPNAASSHLYLAGIYWQEEDFPSYFKEEEKWASLNHNDAEIELVRTARTAFVAGGKARMLQIIEARQEQLYRQGRFSAYSLAATLAQLGRKQEALSYLQTAFQKHDPHLVGLRADTRLISLRGAPEYRDLLAKVGLPPMA